LATTTCGGGGGATGYLIKISGNFSALNGSIISPSPKPPND